MDIVSYNPGHDGAVAHIQNKQLLTLVEVEKNSNFRHSGVSVHDFLNILNELKVTPDVICEGGWWSFDTYLTEKLPYAGYRGILKSNTIASRRLLMGKEVEYFSSTHERSHLLCAFGMSSLPKGTPCYALIWEGTIGSFYEIDSNLNITILAEVMQEPGHRYAMLYGLADSSFEKNLPFTRISDAGKLMALASYSKRSTPSAEEEWLIKYLLQDCQNLNPIAAYEELKHTIYYNIGLDDPEFRNFVGIFSDRIFDTFYQFAKVNMNKGLPLLIAGGCGLNCDWNIKWKESGLFPEVFVTPVANDSGSAIGTAIDAQFYYTGNPKIEWDVYSGLSFDSSCSFDVEQYDIYHNNELIADMLANDLILAWVNGKYEIGPRALGNRSILAAPFKDSTRVRLNEIKQREQFRPIAPVCLEEDAAKWFGCDHSSPYMLYSYIAKTDELAAVTHVNKTARLQTVSCKTNNNLYNLLTAFKERTGYGVLCNTSLNFNGRGFINKIDDLSTYVTKRSLDGFVIDGRSYILKSSKRYQAYLKIQYKYSI